MFYIGFYLYMVDKPLKHSNYYGGLIMELVINGYYEHYKKKLYLVKGVAKHSETLEELVVYQAMYGNKDLWVRPKEMFCETVTKNDMTFQRFKYVGNKIPLNYREEKVKIEIEIPDDISLDLYENKIDLEQELNKSHEDIEIIHKGKGDHSKDLSLVILASGISISSVLLAVTHVINAVNYRPRALTIIEKNDDGEIIKTTPILCAPKKPNEKMDISFSDKTSQIELKISEESCD